MDIPSKHENSLNSLPLGDKTALNSKTAAVEDIELCLAGVTKLSQTKNPCDPSTSPCSGIPTRHSVKD